ncbi:MAG: DUF4198 domain-containing protein [Reyranella sp.]|nr:MAG: DUF4198 domain-containing protein [Reyranella sp.]
MEAFMRFILAAILMLSPVAASADALWLEIGPAGMELVYGDFGENQRDGLLGRLERAPAAKTFGPSGEQSLKLEKRGAGYQLRGLSVDANAVVAEQAWIVERKQDDKPVRTLNRLAARYAAELSEQQAVIPLDVVPTGKAGQFRILYDGKPLPNAQASVTTEAGWKRDVRTDQAGNIEIALPWKGIYVIEVAVADNSPGTMGPEAYDGMRLVTTLAFRVGAGMDGPPRPAATARR